MDCAYSVIIATFRRPTLLQQTLAHLMPQVGVDGEVIVVEQCPLIDIRADLAQFKHLRHIVLDRPGTVAARNYAVNIARGRILIFVDDDVIPSPHFLLAHQNRYDDPSICGIAGRVIEKNHPPQESPDSRSLDPVNGWRYCTFDHSREMDVPHAPTCNLSLLREHVVAVGGFDDRFRLAWREDSDLCFRVRALGYRIRFSPDAWLTHLSASEGGTRGDSLTRKSWRLTVRKYTLLNRHYGDNLYFLIKHFRGASRLRWIWDAYRIHVGFSRRPWRLVAKNLCFLVALCQAVSRVRYRSVHPCSLDESNTSSYGVLKDSEPLIPEPKAAID